MKNNNALFIAPLVALAMVASPVSVSAATAKPAQSEDASVPFIDHGAIRDWRADGDRVIYFQDSGRQWYRATLMNNCLDLPYAQAIGFDARGTNTFDRFSAVIVRGQRCPLTSRPARAQCSSG